VGHVSGLAADSFHSREQAPQRVNVANSDTESEPAHCVFKSSYLKFHSECLVALSPRFHTMTSTQLLLADMTLARFITRVGR
jgi:hypothetical protein